MPMKVFYIKSELMRRIALTERDTESMKSIDHHKIIGICLRIVDSRKSYTGIELH